MHQQITSNVHQNLGNIHRLYSGNVIVITMFGKGRFVWGAENVAGEDILTDQQSSINYK
jgi:hypothetical protein